MKLVGAEVLVECLLEQNVDIIFGYPGGAVLPIYDALYKYEADNKITHIITAHEQGAAHAADGYARATGKVGVVIATSGPGATNTVTGIATAYLDSVPLVVFTGQVSRALLGKDSFQEVNFTDITVSITKKNFIVTEASKFPEIIREAFRIARSGRPGPVVIDIPKDIQTSMIEYERSIIDTSFNPTASSKLIAYNKESELNYDVIADAINKSERPVIYAGGGVNISGAQDELLKFAEKIKSPVACSLMGLGCFPGNHPYYMGMVGMHGTRCSNYAMSKCDLLIAIGARFSDRVVSDIGSFAVNAKVIHIDIDPSEFSKNVDAQIPICGDVNGILKRLNQIVDDKKENNWNDQIKQWKQEYPLKYVNNGKLSPQYVMQKLYDINNGNCIITTEVGQNQIWAAQFYTFTKPRTFISSGGLGTMGYGLGAAIGASFGKTGYKVINVAGDGSFKMNSTELATISKYKIPLVQLVFNNHCLGMVRQWQDLFYGGRFSHTTLTDDVDFVKLANAYNIHAVRITDNSQVEQVLSKALSLNEPILIECMVDHDDKVFPIVPPGEPINNIIDFLEN